MKSDIGFSVLPTPALACVVFLVFLLVAAPPTRAQKLDSTDAEDAYRANNVGVAELEQFNYEKAAAAFRRALAIRPDLKIAQTNLAIALLNAQDYDGARRSAEAAAEGSPASLAAFYVLGLIAKNQNRTDDAVKYFKIVLEADPSDVGTNVNLGQIYVQQGVYEQAAVNFRRAVEAEPYNTTAVYNLATVLLRGDAREEGRSLLTRFQALRQSGAATAIGQNYLEQGRYAEAIASTGAESDLIDTARPKLSFRAARIGLPIFARPARGGRKPLASGPEPKAPSAALFDFDNDGDLDLIEVAGDAPRLYRNDSGRFTDVTRAAGALGRRLNMRAFGVIAGDYDNDTFADLLIFGDGRPVLFRGNGAGFFQDVTAAAKIPATSIVSISGAMVDADHDGDLDIFLGGFRDNTKKASAAAPNRLLRNNGDGTFTDISESAKISLPSRSVAVVPTDFDNRRDVDLLVLNRGSRPYLFRNMRDRTFKDVAGDVGLNRSGEWTCAAAGDFNKDGYTDFFFGRADGPGVFATSDGRGRFVLRDAPAGTDNAASAQFLDYDNDGLLDLIVNTGTGFIALRNLGGSWGTADGSVFDVKSGENALFGNSRLMLAGDVDADGDVDLFAFGRSGNLQFFANDGGNANNSESVRLEGRVSNRTGIGAKIDLRAGSLSQKLESYSASPMPAPSEIRFGLGRRAKPDAIRVLWTSGVVQAELAFQAGANGSAAKQQSVKIEELDRKPSSCPYLYAWNGEKFEFVTDFLGGGEMGAWQSTGLYNSPKSDEVVRITSDQLKPNDGKYEIRVTNELEEVLFLDSLKLFAVEHDADQQVFPNEGLGISTAGEKLLYTIRNSRPPLSAAAADGHDVLPKIANLDRSFYDDFESQNIRGYAKTHSLTLNLDDKKNFGGRTLLLLTGWTDYAFSSDNLAASQSGRSLFLPKLQVKNAQDEWQTVVESIGIPIGRPQTVVVDLTGKFLSASREVRIVTNYKTFWDKIAVDTSEQDAAAPRMIELQRRQADLRERGFSAETMFGGMIVPDYNTVLNDGRWKYFSGTFTRVGDVGPLLRQTDDVFVISKTGDELVLTFDALPELPKNRKYTFLLYADGYSKEMDINSASPDAVLPLPFKAMSRYPYGEDEQFPMTEERRRIYNEYTTRVARRLLPSIETSLTR